MRQISTKRPQSTKFILSLLVAGVFLVLGQPAAWAQCDGSSIKNAHMQASGDRTTLVSGPTLQNRQVTTAQFNAPASSQAALNQYGPNADSLQVYFPQGAPNMNNILSMVTTSMAGLTGATGIFGGLLNSVTTLFTSLGGMPTAAASTGSGCSSPTITQFDYRKTSS